MSSGTNIPGAPDEYEATAAEPEDEVIMEIRDTSIEFDMSRGVSRVLNDVNIDLHRGEVVGVVGESGSGKSMFAATMLDAVVDPGVLRGDITYHADDGQEIDVLELNDRSLRQFRWEAVAMVFQGAMNSFNPVLTVRAHFRDTIDAHNAPPEETMDHAYRLLRDLYLEPDRILDSYPHELSGGQKQRALIALSLLLQPNVLVMDEPTAALDLLMQRSIIDLLKELQDEYEFTMVFITHDLPLVKELCDRVAVMYAFEFVEVGPTRRIIENSRHPYTRALLNATPNLDTPVEEMRPIEGSSPDPVNVPAGCAYHTRCPMADQRCEAEHPDLVEVEDDHRAACFYWDNVPDNIPINIPGAGDDEGGDGE
ncbi:MAG: ABC transporter ATP-binding protein [Halobacteriaceae archaeon]